MIPPRQTLVASPLMPPTGALACAACLVLLLHNSASAETYQWTDKHGNVGFADSLEKVPPQYRKSMKRLEDSGPSGTFQTVPTTPGSEPTIPIESPSSEDLYAAWRTRLDTARADLQELKAKRDKAKEEYDNLVNRQNMPTRPLDPETGAKASSRISELDQQIRDKEYEISFTIPDEARRAGVPPSVLSP